MRDEQCADGGPGGQPEHHTMEPVRKLDESGTDYEYAVSMSAGRPLANYPPGSSRLAPTKPVDSVSAQ